MKVLLREFAESARTQARTAFLLDAERIDEMIVVLTPEVRTGNLPAMDRFTRLLERRAKMFGYDQPEKLAVDLNTDIEKAEALDALPENLKRQVVTFLRTGD